MTKSTLREQSGSVLVMAVLLSFCTILLGVAFLRSAVTLNDQISWDINKMQADYDAIAGLREGLNDKMSGHALLPGMRYYFGKKPFTNYTGYDITFIGSDEIDYGTSSNFYILGKGRSDYVDGGVESSIGGSWRFESYADYLYISNKERDARRNVIIRFWTPDTLDGKVHSNDTIHIVTNSDRPRFMKRVTTTAGYIDPPNNHATFDEKWGWKTSILFPDQATEIRNNAGWFGGTVGSDSLMEITLDYDGFRWRKCGPFVDDSGNVIIRCFPATIGTAPLVHIPRSGVIFIYGKCWVKASRGLIDRMDGEFPELDNDDGGYVSQGFHGQLTIGCSDTMIIPDNLIFYGARPNNSIPSSMDSCSDILGLVSENYIMVGETVRPTIYINAAMAAIKGSISVQDIYKQFPVDELENEKQSLFIWGSLAQRNRGIVRTTDYPPGYIRGFPEKDYHYDIRLKDHPPPHFLPARKTELRFYVSVP